ncbi:MAG: DUF3201 domain-containing protein [Christensenellales bacterium]
MKNAGCDARGGFYNNHYVKKESDWAVEYYPIPVISVKDVCDIGLDIDRTFVEFKLKKQAALAFDWTIFGEFTFEVYGADDFLNDFYSPDSSIKELKEKDKIGKKISLSDEREIAVSIRLGYLAGEDVLLSLVEKLSEILAIRG